MFPTFFNQKNIFPRHLHVNQPEGFEICYRLAFCANKIHVFFFMLEMAYLIQISEC